MEIILFLELAVVGHIMPMFTPFSKANIAATQVLWVNLCLTTACALYAGKSDNVAMYVFVGTILSIVMVLYTAMVPHPSRGYLKVIMVTWPSHVFALGTLLLSSHDMIEITYPTVMFVTYLLVSSTIVMITAYLANRHVDRANGR